VTIQHKAVAYTSKHAVTDIAIGLYTATRDRCNLTTGRACTRRAFYLFLFIYLFLI